MKLTKSKLQKMIKEEYQDAHRAIQRGGPGYKPRKFRSPTNDQDVVDMTGRSYNVEELAQYLDEEEIEVLLSRPEMYFCSC